MSWGARSSDNFLSKDFGRALGAASTRTSFCQRIRGGSFSAKSTFSNEKSMVFASPQILRQNFSQRILGSFWGARSSDNFLSKDSGCIMGGPDPRTIFCQRIWGGLWERHPRTSFCQRIRGVLFSEKTTFSNEKSMVFASHQILRQLFVKGFWDPLGEPDPRTTFCQRIRAASWEGQILGQFFVKGFGGGGFGSGILGQVFVKGFVGSFFG